MGGCLMQHHIVVANSSVDFFYRSVAIFVTFLVRKYDNSVDRNTVKGIRLFPSEPRFGLVDLYWRKKQTAV